MIRPKAFLILYAADPPSALECGVQIVAVSLRILLVVCILVEDRRISGYRDLPAGVVERDDPEESGDPFRYGLEDAFLSWLKEDLASVSKDTPVMICTHANTIEYGIRAKVRINEFGTIEKLIP